MAAGSSRAAAHQLDVAAADSDVVLLHLRWELGIHLLQRPSQSTFTWRTASLHASRQSTRTGRCELQEFGTRDADVQCLLKGALSSPWCNEAFVDQ
jgi:hypothetical protein